MGTAFSSRLRALAVGPLLALCLTASTARWFDADVREQAAQRAAAVLADALWPGSFSLDAVDATRVHFDAARGAYRAQLTSTSVMIGDAAGAVGLRFEAARPRRPARPAAALAPLRVFDRVSAAAGRAYERYGEVTFAGVYPGIDVRYRSTGGSLEIVYVVAPGADARAISLAAAPGTTLSSTADGNVVAQADRARYVLRRPIAYQEVSGRRVVVPVRARVIGQRMQFELGHYDRAWPLVIDPLVMTWSTFVGSRTDAFYDNAIALRTDDAGNVYVAGRTQISRALGDESFPTTAGSYLASNVRSPGDACAFGCGYVLKLDPQHRVVYGALIHGLDITALALDADRNVYVTGSTLEGINFPGPDGSFLRDPAGQAFLAKLSADGSTLVYAAQFPGHVGNAVAVDAGGNAYVAGMVDVPNLPTTPGVVKAANPVVSDRINEDAFVLKVDPTGSRLVWGTYLGGSGPDVANALLLADDGRVLVGGRTASADFTGFEGPIRGGSDAFWLELSADASTIQRGQRLGGSADDYVTAAARDGSGGVLLCGATTSADLPVTSGVLQSRLLGDRNGWIQRLDAEWRTSYATYFGGQFIDGCLGITGDASGRAYIVGTTFSLDLPVTPDALQSGSSALANDLLGPITGTFYPEPLDTPREAYFAQLSADGQRVLYATYLGGYSTEPRGYAALGFGSGIALAPDGTVYVSGHTDSPAFPTSDGGLRTGMGGNADGFLTAFAPSNVSVSTPSLLPPAVAGASYSQQLVATGGAAPYAWEIVSFRAPDGLTLDASGRLSGTVATSQSETDHEFTVKVRDASGAVAYRHHYLKVLYPGNAVCTATACSMSVLVGQTFIVSPRILNRGVAPFRVSVLGTLPPGSTVDSTNGTVTTTPTTAGTYPFAFRVTDAVGSQATLDWTVTVTASGNSPAPPTTPPPSPPPTPTPPTNSGGGGGGGAMSLLGLCMLLALMSQRALARRLSRARAQQSSEPVYSAAHAPKR